MYIICVSSQLYHVSYEFTYISDLYSICGNKSGVALIIFGFGHRYVSLRTHNKKKTLINYLRKRHGRRRVLQHFDFNEKPREAEAKAAAATPTAAGKTVQGDKDEEVGEVGR